MRGYLASPRRRRRAAGIGFAFITVAATVTVAWVGRGGGLEPVPSVVAASAPATPVASADVEAPFTNAVRDEVLPVASRFVATAVDRKRLDEAWTLVRPQLKAGYTLERWRTGEIPVVPYPVGSAEWEVQYSLRNEVGLYVLLHPRRGQDVQSTTFVLVLARERPGDSWLVSEWVPAATPAAMDASDGPGSGAVLASVDAGGAFDQGNLSPLFLVLPVVGTIGVVLAGAAFFLLRGWRRNRRAAAAYASRELPPLPPRYSSSS